MRPRMDFSTDSTLLDFVVGVTCGDQGDAGDSGERAAAEDQVHRVGAEALAG